MDWSDDFADESANCEWPITVSAIVYKTHKFFFCFDFGEIHSGSDASRGPSEVKYSAKVHVRSALCHLFCVRGARNCSWYLFYAESVTLHSLWVGRLCAESVTLHSLWVTGLCAESVTLHSLSESQDYVQNMSPYTLSELQDYVQNLSPYNLSQLQDYVQNLSRYTHIPPFIKICKN